MALATSLPLATGEFVPVEGLALGDVIYLDPDTRKAVGLTLQEAGDAIADAADAITIVTASTYDWNTTVRNLGSQYAAGTQAITLPDETQITNWVPGEPPRRLYKLQTSANGMNLLVGANCTINGDTAGTDASPIAGSTVNPAATTNAPYWLVYRESATAYWLLGYAS